MSDALRLSNAGSPALAGDEREEETPPSEAREFEPSLYKFILRYSWKDQLVLLATTGISLPFYYFSLNLPKTIVNDAIGDKPKVSFPVDFYGLSSIGLPKLDRIDFLWALCALFLALVFINGAFKYVINVLSGRTGERMLRRLRYDLYHRLIRFPTGHFRKVSPAQVIPMITAEVETLGGFIGEAFNVPVQQGGQWLTLLFFMFVQDWKLGLAAVSLYPMQGYVIPRLQKKVNQLGKQRVRTVRVLADRVGESASGITEIRSNDAARWQLAQVSHVLGTIYEIRYEIFQRKFFVKFLNNFINQLTPFFFFSIGGYLVLTGGPDGLSLGALVAVLSAYKDLASPWKELLDFYQRKEDSRIKYEQIIEQFQPRGMLDERRQLGPQPAKIEFTGDLVVANLSLVEDERERVVDSVSFSLPLACQTAVVGQASSGKSELAMLLACLVEPSGGRISIGPHALNDLPLTVLGRRIGYAGATPHLFTGSLGDNLYFGLRTQPNRPPEYGAERARKMAASLEEARRAGNIDADVNADWIDYEMAGVKDREELLHRTTEILSVVDFDEDVYGFGLRGRIHPARQPEVAAQLLEARRTLAERLQTEHMQHLVELFDPERYNTNASLAENLLFGTPVGPAFELGALATNSYVLEVLDTLGLRAELTDMGLKAASEMVDIFADLPPGHEIFEQFSFVSESELETLRSIVARAKGGEAALKVADRHALLSLPFKIIVARHRLDVALREEAMQRRIVEARKALAAGLPEETRGQIAFFDPAAYNDAATLQDNILFGKIAYGEADAGTRVPQLVTSVLNDLGLRATVIAVGLDFGVGTGGTRLSLAQRQKAAIARALLKRPSLLILNEATAALDGASQAKVLNRVREACNGSGLIWALHRASFARSFDRVLVMSTGRVVEQGTPAELDAGGATFKVLVGAE